MCILYFFFYLQDKRKFDDSMIEDDSDDGMVENRFTFYRSINQFS